MGRHRKPRPGGPIAQSDEARRLLREDTPESVKLALRLALRGGRQERRRCLGCGRVGISCKVYSPPEAWNVESTDTRGIRVYWLCERCNEAYAGGLPAALEAKLLG
jgi:hypothetical protein